MNRDQRVTELGNLGERLVIKYFDMEGCSVYQSTDPYDQDKDMIVDGKTVEVKTLLPIYIYKAFCLPAKQTRKCESVDRLIFVKIPDAPDGQPIQLYEATRNKEGKRWDFRTTFNNEQCQFYKLTNLQELGIMHDNEASVTMWNLSPSKYKGTLNAA